MFAAFVSVAQHPIFADIVGVHPTLLAAIVIFTAAIGVASDRDARDKRVHFALAEGGVVVDISVLINGQNPCESVDTRQRCVRMEGEASEIAESPASPSRFSGLGFDTHKDSHRRAGCSR